MANGTAITRADAERAIVENERNRSVMRNLRRRAEDATNQLLQTIEINTFSFGFGLINGYSGGAELLGVPVDLGAGVALHTLGLLGVAGRSSDHLHNMGDGALAAFFATLGCGVGTKWRAERAAPQPVVRGNTLSDAELAELASQG